MRAAVEDAVGQALAAEGVRADWVCGACEGDVSMRGGGGGGEGGAWIPG